MCILILVCTNVFGCPLGKRVLSFFIIQFDDNSVTPFSRNVVDILILCNKANINLLIVNLVQLMESANYCTQNKHVL